jgi:glyoxylase-like metal-dependent hydrolase (beta-lactamase superfamily II)
MQTARLFIGTGKQTRIGLLSAPVFKTRAPISNVLNGQIRSLHQHIQKESSTSSSPLTPHPPPPFPTTTPRLPQKLPSHTISTQLHSIASEILLSPQTQNPIIHSSYEKATGTWQYLVADPSTLQAVIIDSVLDYNPTTQVISTQTADSLFSLISSHKYKITKILETHAHADHLSAASYLQHRIAQSQGLRPPICIGKRITQVQEMFGKKYGISAEEYRNAFDRLFDDDEVFEVGELKVKVMHLPGHTPDHIGYIIGGK